MFLVGLTGGIGSGKSTVAALFEARGAVQVDTDAIAHELTVPGGAAMAPIRAAFGEGVVAPDGALDRAAMRQRVFTDGDARRRLEAILHPMIRAEADRRCGAAQAPYVILAVPLLVESGQYRDRADRILVVDCDPARQIARVVARNGLTEAQVRAILAVQASREARLAAADDVVRNEDGPDALEPQVARLHEHYLNLARQKAIES